MQLHYKCFAIWYHQHQRMMLYEVSVVRNLLNSGNHKTFLYVNFFVPTIQNYSQCISRNLNIPLEQSHSVCSLERMAFKYKSLFFNIRPLPISTSKDDI